MADRSSERDRRVRELLRNKTPGFDVIGQAQAEIQDAQSELYNHVALQQAQDQSRLREMGTISQAAGGMMAMESQGDQLQYQASQMNPTTQATLSKFGVKPSQNTQRNTTNQRVVTKSGDTTNIRNESITNNRTDIKITQPSIPMSQPVIPMRGNVSKEDNTSKFKAWLSGMFARQQNEAEIQKKEYRKKEWALGRTTSKLMKKIGETTSGLSNKLDPKNMTSTLGGQLKWLLLIFGATMIGKVWKPAMKFLANLEGGFRAVFGLPMNEDLKHASSGTLSVIDKIKKAIGVENDNESLISGIGKVFMQGIDKLIDKIGFWFEDRKTALGEVEFPSMGDIDFGALGGVLGPAMDGVVSALKGVGQYLGDLITVAFGGSKGKVKVEARKVQRQAQEVFTNTKGKQTSAGDAALMTGNGRNYMKDSDYDTFGNLKGNASSTQAMSQSLISMFNDKSGVGHTAEIATGVSQLFGTAKRNGQVVIDPTLLQYLGLNQSDITTLQRNGMLSQKTYRIIAVKPNEAQKTELGAYDGNWGLGVGAAAGAGLGAWGGAVLGAKAGAAIGSFGGPIGTGIGAALGGIGGGLIGAFGGGLIGGGAGSGVDQMIRDWTSKGLYPKLVPDESKEVGADGSRGFSKKMWVLNKQGAEAVIGKFTHEMKNKDFDLTNKEFYSKIAKIEEDRKRRNGYNGNIKQNLDTNGLQVAQTQLDVYNKEWYDRYESKDKNSYNQQHFGNWNAAWDSGANLLNQGLSFIHNGAEYAQIWAAGKKIGKPEQNRRAMYLMDKLIKAGFTPQQAAGVAGNVMRESSFITEKAYNPNDAGHGPGGGLVGWLGDNCREVLGYAKRDYGCNVDPNNVEDILKVPFEVQADILVKQLTGEYNYSGSKRGKTAGDAVRRASSAGEAANLFERKFEVSADYRLNNNRHRIEFANGFQDLWTSNGGVVPQSQQNFTTVSSVNFNLDLLRDQKIVSGEQMGVAWIGDSQSCVSNGLWPQLVGQGIGTQIKYFARVSAHAGHYIGNNTEDRLPSGPVTNLTSARTCKDALNVIINSSPKYVFIALGHNGMTGYSSLVTKLKGSGATVIGIKMWAIDGKNSGMATYTADQMSRLYENISLENWIDLTHVNIPKSSDGVHASTEGCRIAAQEVLTQLMTGVTTNDIQESEQGIGSTLLGYVETAAGFVADLTDPNNSSSGNSELLNQRLELTDRERQALEEYSNYKTANLKVNIGSFEHLGAITDESGTYFNVGGGYRAYVNPESTNAFFGMDSSKVSMYAKEGPNGKLQDVTEDERRFINTAVSTSIVSLFSTYEGKGSSGDRMKKQNGDPWFFDLGEYKDIDGFSKPAQENLKQKNGGKIRFSICPTKDRSRFSIIKISPKFPSGFADFHSDIHDSDQTAEIVAIGPIIYELGRRWVDPNSALEGKKLLTDWQPAAFYNRVTLTPGAEIKLREVFRILALGKITKNNRGWNADGRFYDQNGNVVSSSDVELMKELGIIGHNGGRTLIDEVKDGYNEAQSTAAAAISVSGKFSLSSYLDQLGINSSELSEREKYLRENKELFSFRGGKIYGPGGVEWGTFENDDENNFTLYDDETLNSINTAFGESGLRENEKRTSDEKAIQVNDAFGGIEHNIAADWMASVSSKSNSLLSAGESDRINARRRSGGRKSRITESNKINGKIFKYYLFTDINGNVDRYLMTPEQFKEFYKAATGSDYNTNMGQPERIEVSGNRDKFLNKILEVAANTQSELSGSNNKDVSTIISDLNNSLEYNSDPNFASTSYHGTTALLRQLLEDGDLVEGIEYKKDDKQIVTYANGRKREFRFYIPKDLAPGSEFIGNVNEQIRLDARDKQIQRGIDNWDSEDNLYRRNLENLVTAANEGNIHVDYGDDGYVRNRFGDVIGKYDQNKSESEREVQNLSAEEASGFAIDYWNKTENKIKFYKRRYGAVVENGGVYVYGKDRKTRAKINLDIPLLDASGNINSLNKVLDRDLVEALDNGSGNTWVNTKSKGYSKYNAETGVWEDVSGFWDGYDENHSAENVAEQIVNSISDLQGSLEDGFDIQAEYAEEQANELAEQTGQGKTAALQEINQIKQGKQQIANQQSMVDILREIASKTLSEEEMTTLISKINTNNSNVEKEGLFEAVKRVGLTGANAGEIVYKATNTENNGMENLVVRGNDVYKVTGTAANPQLVEVPGLRGSVDTGSGEIHITSGNGNITTYNINGSYSIPNQTVDASE